jgi:hypothetical protein
MCFWILSIVLFLFKTHNVSETGFCLLFRWNLMFVGFGIVRAEFKGTVQLPP